MMLYNEKTDGPLVQERNRVIINIWTAETNEAIRGHNVGHVSVETSDEYMSLWPGAREHLMPSKNNLHRKIRAITNKFEVRPKHFNASYLNDALAEGMSEGRTTERQINDFSEREENEQAILFNSSNGEYEICEEAVALDQGDKLYAIKFLPIEASVRIALYSLDLKKIHQCFDDLKNNVKGEKIKGWSMIGSNGLQRILNIPSADNCASFALRLLKAGGMYADISSAVSSTTSSVVTPDAILTQVVAAKEKEWKNFPETRQWKFEGESSIETIKEAYALKGMSANAEDSSWKTPSPSNNQLFQEKPNAQEQRLAALSLGSKKENDEDSPSGCRLF